MFYFFLQVAVLAQLNHPNIVTYKESFEGKYFYILPRNTQDLQGSHLFTCLTDYLCISLVKF